MVKRLLSGNEAVAYGAWEAGVAVASGYPGTPSTEILEHFARLPNVYAEWSPNEKVAMDVAVGAAYAGKRALSTMKHVGVNVAADTLFYASMTGSEAGIVFVSADDPAMHSSQNEQDNRNFAKFARIPCLDPADSQDAHDLTISAYEISEQFDTPVLLRLTTRICHTSTPVQIGSEQLPPKPYRRYPRNPAKYVMVPGNARHRHPVIEERIVNLSQFAENYPFNRVEMRSNSLGIITGGLAYQYARDVFPDASLFKLGMVYPLPVNSLKEFSAKMEKVIVLEELDPFIEEQVRLIGITLYPPNPTYPMTKSIFPIYGEFNAKVVHESAVKAGLLKKHSIENTETAELVQELDRSEMALPNRPPVLCAGCPHRSTFYVLSKLDLPVNGDIGCYTLGFVPPLNAIHSCGCMGASIGVAHGGAVAKDNERHIAVIGDSTFYHTGIPALIGVAYNHSNVITVILDNVITGMTGHQGNPGTGDTLLGLETQSVDLESLVRSIGISLVKTIDAYDVKVIEKTLKEWLKNDEPAVLIARHECALLPSERVKWEPLTVIADECNGCALCFRIGCPAIIKSEQLDDKYQRPLADIDPLLCTGCEICAQICPRDAIVKEMAA